MGHGNQTHVGISQLHPLSYCDVDLGESCDALHMLHPLFFVRRDRKPHDLDDLLMFPIRPLSRGRQLGGGAEAETWEGEGGRSLSGENEGRSGRRNQRNETGDSVTAVLD